MNTLQKIKNTYAIEQGYEDWDDLSEKNNYANDYELHWTSVCIRAQKVALEKTAGKAEVQHHNTRTGTKVHASRMVSKGQVYTVDRTSITNPENLIR